MKPPVVLISSSSDDDGDDDEGDLDEEFSSEEEGDSESDDQEYYEEEKNDVESDEEECSDDLRDVCFNQGSNDLQELSLNECKAYLRKHRLRLSGTKEECIQRIKEHGRLKDGSSESLYPRSSFSINCTGDACKGDVVLFKQKVHNKFDKVAKRGNIDVKRTVAGRIIRESYGASKQQHTFTIEVLWSKGSRKLPLLSTLLVKGRNLYRFWTFRQPWKSEAERSKVLGEKHDRGNAARHKRKLYKTEIASNNDRGTKHRKLSHRGPSRSKQPTQTNKHKSVNKSTTAHKRKTLQFQKAGLTRSTQPTFRSKATLTMSTQPTFRSNLNHSNHHLQEASSSSLPYDTPSSLPNFPPLWFPGYGHHVPHHYNYEQPVFWYRLG